MHAVIVASATPTQLRPSLPPTLPQAVSRPLTTSRRTVKAAARKQQLRRAPADRDAKVAVAVPAEEEVTVREEKLDACGTRLHITVSAQKCKQAYKKVMDDFRREANVAGYRKGKVCGKPTRCFAPSCRPQRMLPTWCLHALPHYKGRSQWRAIV